MKFFVTGVGGQLGHDVMNELLKRGHKGVGSDIQESYSGVADDSAVTKAPYVALDITDKNAVEKVITEVNPDAVIHCAAWTAVDMAEDDDKVAKVRAINAGGTQNIADVCKKLDCKMTYISTDYVFDGQGTEPWRQRVPCVPGQRAGAGGRALYPYGLHAGRLVEGRRRREGLFPERDL